MWCHNLPSGLTVRTRAEWNHYTSNDFSTNCQNVSEKKKHFSAPTITRGKDSQLPSRGKMLKSSSENCWAAAPGGISRTRLCHSANQYHGIFLVRFCNARRMKTLNSINVTKIDAVSAAHSIVHTISANHPFMSPRITVKKKIDFWIMALWDKLTSSGDFLFGGFFWV